MIDAIASFARLLLTSLGMVAGVDAGSVALFAAAVATAVLLVLLLAASTSWFGSAVQARPARQIDVSAPLSQSDPDAAGHPRSRAPGDVALAA
ncbi:DUF6412 domain-containing protein [Microbacterium sp. P01]|uniref:DUF6412 domain-containing protein n=1 Tax=Microbacterium sp. P01 TaxID=3366261 RepID=UPI00366DA736